jgi:hypothetical protein
MVISFVRVWGGEAYATPSIIVISYVRICRGEAHATPSIIVISFVRICRDEVHITPFITIIIFVRVWEGEIHAIPCIVIISFAQILRGEAYATPSISILIFVRVCGAKTYAILSLTVISFAQVWGGEAHATPFVTVISFGRVWGGEAYVTPSKNSSYCCKIKFFYKNHQIIIWLMTKHIEINVPIFIISFFITKIVIIWSYFHWNLCVCNNLFMCTFTYWIALLTKPVLLCKIFPTFETECGEYSTKYYQSNRTLLWIWIMLW